MGTVTSPVPAFVETYIRRNRDMFNEALTEIPAADEQAAIEAFIDGDYVQLAGILIAQLNTYVTECAELDAERRGYCCECDNHWIDCVCRREVS